MIYGFSITFLLKNIWSLFFCRVLLTGEAFPIIEALSCIGWAFSVIDLLPLVYLVSWLYGDRRSLNFPILPAVPTGTFHLFYLAKVTLYYYCFHYYITITILVLNIIINNFQLQIGFEIEDILFSLFVKISEWRFPTENKELKELGDGYITFGVINFQQFLFWRE